MAGPKTFKTAEKKRRSKKRKSRLEVSSSSESDSDVEVQEKGRDVALEASPEATPEVAAASTAPVPKQKEKRKKKSKAAAAQDSDSDVDISMPDAPTHFTASSASKAFTGQQQEEFNALYLRKITGEVADDLDKVREAQDFKASSVPMLIHALKQGESLFSAEEKRRVVAARQV